MVASERVGHRLRWGGICLRFGSFNSSWTRSISIVQGLVIEGGIHVEVLNAISLHGGLPGSWPCREITAKIVVPALIERWRQVGLPGFAQFDNDTRFQGPHSHPDAFGRVIRSCLGLGVIPVFTPPRETGFQASIESFNGRWQEKVWHRFHHASLPGLQGRSLRYIRAAQRNVAARVETAPKRRPFPKRWALNLQAPLNQGKVIFLRRTDSKGRVEFLGHRFVVSSHWLHRLVRAVVDLPRRRIDFFALRRRDPSDQPLLLRVPYRPPNKRFQE